MLRLGFNLSFGLQYRVFAIPWLERNSVTKILCLEQRDYSTSAPVRYVPWKSRKTSKNVTPQPVDDSEKVKYASTLDLSIFGCKVKDDSRGTGRRILLDLEKQSKNRRHGNVLHDDSRQELEEVNYDVVLSGHELMREPEEVYDEIGLDTEKDSSKQGTIAEQARKTMQDVENMATKYLASRAYSAAELKKKLMGKRFRPDIIDKVIINFQCRGLINDSLYAESFSRSRWCSSTWGPRRIKQALFKKGVSNNDADMAIKLVFNDGEDGEDGEEPKHGLSKGAMDQLYVQASKQWLRGRDVPHETRKARLVRWLQYRGFSWPVIGTVLKKLECGDHCR